MSMRSKRYNLEVLADLMAQYGTLLFFVSLLYKFVTLAIAGYFQYYRQNASPSNIMYLVVWGYAGQYRALWRGIALVVAFRELIKFSANYC